MKQHIIRNPVSIVYSWEHITFDEINVENVENVNIENADQEKVHQENVHQDQDQDNDKNGLLQWFYNKLWSQI